MIINEDLKNKDISQIKPKSILMYKFETIGQMKDKIIKLLKYSLSRNNIDDQNALNIPEIINIKLYRALEYKSKLKRSLIKLIYSFKLNSKKFRIPGFLIDEDDKKIGVSS